MPTLTQDDAWDRLAAARSAVLATSAPDGSADLVPITFVLERPTLWFAVDDVKPKSTLRLGRLANIGREPRVTVVADRYEDDWSQLWWVRSKGTAAVVAARTEASAVLDALAAKYPPYADHRPPGPVVRVDLTAIRGWAAHVR